jgi:hypothetical protein
MRTRTRTAVALALGTLAALATATPVFTTAPGAQGPPRRADRFDDLVRADFFAGLRGDSQRLARAMKLCEETLAASPDHPDALVWHGSGLLFLAGEAAARGDFQTARERAIRGRQEMDRADRLAPDSLSVTLVRAAVLNTAASNVRDPAQSQEMRRAAVAGFERALAVQTPYLERLSEHARGELLGGLAEG